MSLLKETTVRAEKCEGEGREKIQRIFWGKDKVLINILFSYIIHLSEFFFAMSKMTFDSHLAKSG